MFKNRYLFWVEVYVMMNFFDCRNLVYYYFKFFCNE